MVTSETFVRDSIFFIKNDLVSNITDPLSTKRDSDSKFVMTSYPQRKAQYPLITVGLENADAKRTGMQTNAMDMDLTFEVRVWARNVKERDELFEDVLNRLRTIQFTGSGSVNADLHDFNITSTVNVDEAGEGGVHSKVITATYKFINIS